MAYAPYFDFYNPPCDFSYIWKTSDNCSMKKPLYFILVLICGLSLIEWACNSDDYPRGGCHLRFSVDSIDQITAYHNTDRGFFVYDASFPVQYNKLKLEVTFNQTEITQHYIPLSSGVYATPPCDPMNEWDMDSTLIYFVDSINGNTHNITPYFRMEYDTLSVLNSGKRYYSSMEYYPLEMNLFLFNYPAELQDTAFGRFRFMIYSDSTAPMEALSTPVKIYN